MGPFDLRNPLNARPKIHILRNFRPPTPKISCESVNLGPFFLNSSFGPGSGAPSAPYFVALCLETYLTN